jgi:DNA mismatch repair protein MutL
MGQGGRVPGKIQILPDDLTNKIAAGEVVERPASIVKELMENALDAGATDLRIELTRGGCATVKVTDNGEGMAPVDVLLAFARYATSKIYQFDDLYEVHSFGFRGEALPSIASIARVDMTTRQPSALAGTKVTVEAGQIGEIMEVGCPVGTSILVSRIFDTVPVRKKFLKTETTEQGYCMDVVIRLALAHPEVRITVSANGKTVLNIPATRDMGERAALILGADFSDQMVPVKGSGPQLKIIGYASRPEFSRANTKHLYCYVNHRFVRDYFLNHAVMTAYRRVIEPKRYPSVLLDIDVVPGDVDVNVHPAKMRSVSAGPGRFMKRSWRR